MKTELERELKEKTDNEELVKSKKIFDKAMPDRHYDHNMDHLNKHAKDCRVDPDEWIGLPEYERKKHV